MKSGLGDEGSGRVDESCLNPDAPVWQGHASDARSDVSTGDQIAELLASQAQAYQKMASSLKLSTSLPKPELLTFQGDATEYLRFIHSFEASLGDEADQRIRLNFLIQHCIGSQSRR